MTAVTTVRLLAFTSKPVEVLEPVEPDVDRWTLQVAVASLNLTNVKESELQINEFVDLLATTFIK